MSLFLLGHRDMGPTVCWKDFRSRYSELLGESSFLGSPPRKRRCLETSRAGAPKDSLLALQPWLDQPLEEARRSHNQEKWLYPKHHAFG